jgi:hypothetical protein
MSRYFFNLVLDTIKIKRAEFKSLENLNKKINSVAPSTLHESLEGIAELFTLPPAQIKTKKRILDPECPVSLYLPRL